RSAPHRKLAVGAGLRFATNAYLDGAPRGQCGKINRCVGGQLPFESSSRLRAGRETSRNPRVLVDGEKQIRQQRVANDLTTTIGNYQEGCSAIRPPRNPARG